MIASHQRAGNAGELRNRDTNRTVTRMATRQQRIDAFTHEGVPPADQPLEVLCEDHVGTYLVPFSCRWTGDDWTNVETGARIEARVIGWRVRIDGTDG